MVFSKPNLMLNFSTIAKGFGADRVHKALSKKYGSSIFVEIGGEVRASGLKQGSLWGVSIISPMNPSTVDSFKLNNDPAATSGSSFKKEHIYNRYKSLQ
jgi:thiamine biosynthesis lipoprotein